MTQNQVKRSALDNTELFLILAIYMKKVAVVLCGCGVKDGSEIHEATLTLLHLDRQNMQAVCVAPNINQYHVINHVTGDPVDGEARNAMVEAARLARGNISPLEKLDLDSVDGVIFPGGTGAAKNLCDFAYAKGDYSVNAEVADFIKKARSKGKPLGFICIAPVIAAAVIGDGVKLTIGNDPQVAQAIEKKGAKHEECPVDGIAIDEEKRVVSTPAYMLAKRISEVDKGVEKLVRQMASWVA